MNEAVALPAVTFAQLCELLRLLGHYVGASSSALMPIICPKLHYSKANADTTQEHPFKTWDLKAQTLANPDRLSNSVGGNDGHKGFRSPADEAATSVLIAECHAASPSLQTLPAMLPQFNQNSIPLMQQRFAKCGFCSWSSRFLTGSRTANSTLNLNLVPRLA